MKGIISKTTSDQIKRKILSPHLSQLVLDVYITPTEFAQLIEKYDNSEFDLEIKDSVI